MSRSGAANIEEIDQIRREMARIRTDLHFGVQQTVEGVRSLTDLASYIRNAPWLSIGLAMAVGFVLVPGRRPREADQSEVRHVAANEEGRPRQKKGLLRAVVGLVAPIAVRGAQHYAMRALDSFMANHVVIQHPAAEEPRSTSRAS